MNDRLSQAVVTGALCVLAIAGYTSLHGGGGAPEARASNTPSSKGMQVSGVGTVTLHPDQATIVFTTKGRGTSLAAAQNQASRAMQRLISVMQAGGVARTDLQTGSARASKLNSQSATYVANQRLTVTVRTPSKAGALVAKGVNAGAHGTVGPTFSIGDRQKAYDDALAAAVKQARSKADAIAAASGVRVTGIVSVNEGGSPYPYAADGLFAPKDMAYGAASAIRVPTRAGMRQVEAQVNVVFAYG
ncbi:MAG: uncharacterized protein QOF08_116 [Gaiellales bacterium]|jgi:uncharacterized protein YggE|nr:uncharacterized protein [Gaiellales bacterium]